MSTLTHEYLHLTRGTVYESGLALANYTLNSDAGLNYTVSAGVIYDEDIRISISENRGIILIVFFLLNIFFFLIFFSILLNYIL